MSFIWKEYHGKVVLTNLERKIVSLRHTDLSLVFVGQG